MAFQRAPLMEAARVRDAGGTVIGFRFGIEVYDNALPGLRQFDYTIAGEEFAGLPGGAAAKRAAIVAILKREIRKVHDAWVAEAAAAPAAPVVLTPAQIATEVGTSEITSL